jgi:hypothetical protein
VTWSYQDTMPRSIDKVRFYLGDTVSTDPKLTDEEITFALSEAGGVRAAAAICCDRLAAMYASLVDTTVGQLRILYTNRFKQYHEMALILRSRAAFAALPTAGGILVGDKTATQEDQEGGTLVEPSFNVDILDNPYVGDLNTLQGTISDETED